MDVRLHAGLEPRARCERLTLTQVGATQWLREAECRSPRAPTGAEKSAPASRARDLITAAMPPDPGPRSQSSSLEMLVSEPGRCVFLAYKNITIGVWLGQADLRAAQAAVRAGAMMA